MGSVSMTVIGVGAHHNHEYADKQIGGFDSQSLIPEEGKPRRFKSRIPDKDANKLFEEFVDKLRAAGFNVEHASFTHGGRDYP